MREMKDSGIEWIGQIPSNWKIERMQWHLEEKNVGNNPVQTTNILSLTNKRGVIPYEEKGNQGNKSKEDVSGYKLAYPNTIVANSMNVIIGSVGLSKYYGCVSPVYYVFQATNNANIEFFNYIFSVVGFQRELRKYANGILEIRLRVSADNILKRPVAIPPDEEQARIVNFLNTKCSEIDAISADIQKEIETLEQYKRSVITEAVTKGLNPDAEMKDSGAEWIGEVPTNWDLGRIGGFYSLRNEKVSDKDYPPLSVTMKGVLPQLETAAKTNDGDNRKLVRKGDFAINSRSDRRGSCGISKYDGSVSLINTVLTPRGKMSAAYYDWVFHCTRFSDEFYRQGHGIVDDLWTTGWQEMKKIIIPVPPLPEQNRIADYLSSKCSDVDFIISQKNQQVETLANYKKTLIYEYVTGKKEVPVQN